MASMAGSVLLRSMRDEERWCLFWVNHSCRQHSCAVSLAMGSFSSRPRATSCANGVSSSSGGSLCATRHHSTTTLPPSPSKGLRPTSISKIMTPSDHISHFSVRSPWKPSGERYSGVPRILSGPPPSIVRSRIISEMPKSTSSTWGRSPLLGSADLRIIVFAGFRSQWMTPLEWMYSSAEDICCAASQTHGSWSGPFSRSSAARSPPSAKS
mmetsp:Transcript_6553/g.17006  ORF Transcript_6553/g.17006 Transcript_6553/m.17006 type:complete len:211 (-) Transcript_6553:30-662(-)